MSRANHTNPSSVSGSSSSAPEMENNNANDVEAAPAAESGLRQFVLERFEVVTTTLELRDNISRIVKASPRVGAYPRQPVGQLKEVFFAVNKMSIFESVAAETSKAMEAKVRSQEVSGQYAARYFKTPVTPKEILIILGLQFVFFERRGLRSLEEQFDTPHPDHPKFPMTKKRYSAIMGCLNVDFGQFSEILRESWKDAIEPGTEFVVDETMYSFAGHQLDCPKRYIPRKPHPNGLLMYTAAFKTAQGPFVFDVEVDHIFNNPLNGRAVLRDMVERWPWPNQFHVVFDAGFSGDQEHDLLEDLSCFFTGSVNQAHKKWLVDLLKRHCAAQEHIAVVDAHGRVWSFAKDTIANAEHFVVSNAFKTTAKKTREVAITPEQSKSLSKVGVRGLNLLSDKLGLPSSTSEVVLATNITTFINQLVPLVAVVPGAPAQGNGAAAGESNDDLMSLTVPELQVIAKDLNLRVGSKPKAQLLNEIRQARAVKGNEIEAAKTELESGRRRGSRRCTTNTSTSSTRWTTMTEGGTTFKTTTTSKTGEPSSL